MLNKILIWLLETILSWVVSRTTKEVTKIVNEQKEEKAVEVSNAENVVKYEKAKDRLERIKAAEDLLNRIRS
jgi:hypothetical protein